MRRQGSRRPTLLPSCLATSRLLHKAAIRSPIREGTATGRVCVGPPQWGSQTPLNGLREYLLAGLCLFLCTSALASQRLCPGRAPKARAALESMPLQRRRARCSALSGWPQAPLRCQPLPQSQTNPVGAEACCTSACVEGLFAAEASGLVAVAYVTQQSAAAAMVDRQRQGIEICPSLPFRYVSTPVDKVKFELCFAATQNCVSCNPSVPGF